MPPVYLFGEEQSRSIAECQEKGKLKPMVGRDGYVHTSTLSEWRHQASRYWSINGRVTTVMLKENVWKDATRFNAHCEEGVFQELLRECADFGCPRPSSYNDVFHAQFHSPRVRASINNALAPAFTGAWQKAFLRGTFKGTYYRYDLASAYLWATTLGLPTVKSYRLVKDIGGRLPGVYRVKLSRVEPELPYPFNTSTDVLVSTEEMDNYNLPIQRVMFGVEWSDHWSEDAVTDVVKKFSFAKHVSKGFWGRWAGTAPVKCHSKNGRVWPVGNPVQNMVWAHLLVSRVKLRLWEVVDSSVIHVYVDSVITKKPLESGTGLGEWRLEQVYGDGVKVKGPGFYGPRKGPWEKTSGTKKTA